jgi:pyruvate/2-oxoglutarate dehydrogenase complex dihydrolipoamide dehydrogenase (E3) component
VCLLGVSPEESTIRSSNLLQEAPRADGLIGNVEIELDWSLVAARVRSKITGQRDDAPAVARFESHEGPVRPGSGELFGPTTVAVDGMEIEARRGIIIATGSTPPSHPSPGLPTSTIGQPTR